MDRANDRIPEIGEEDGDIDLLTEVGTLLGNVSLVSTEAVLDGSHGTTLKYCLVDPLKGNPSKYFDLGSFRSESESNEGKQDFKDLERLLRAAEEVGQDGPNKFFMVYGMRSCAKALPQPGADAPEETKMEIYRRTFEILTPQVNKILELCEFHEVLCDQIQALFERVALNKEILTETLLQHIVYLVDQAIMLDHIKDSKPCLRNDFALYKRALHVLRREIDDYELLNVNQMKIQQFLSNPRCAKGGAILLHLQDKLAATKNVVDNLCGLFVWCGKQLNNENFLLPEEKWRLLRVLTHILIPLDAIAAGLGPADEKNNVFKSKKLFSPDIVKLFKSNPVIPLFADLHIIVALVLQRCQTSVAMEALIVHDLYDSKIAAHFSLSSNWQDLRTKQDLFLNRFSRVLRKVPPASSRASDCVVDEVYGVVLEGIQFLARCKDIIISQAAYHFATPASLNKIDLRQPSINPDHPGFEYDRVVRLRYSSQDQYVLIDVITMLKSVASTLQRSEERLAPLLRSSIFSQIGHFLYHDLPSVLPKGDSKKKKSLSDGLESLCAVLGTAFAEASKEPLELIVEPKVQIKSSTTTTASKMVSLARRKVGFRSSTEATSKTLSASTSSEPATPFSANNDAIQPRAQSVAPSSTQLDLLSSLAAAILDDLECSTKNKGGFGLFISQKESTQKLAAKAVKRFRNLLKCVNYLLDLSGTVSNLANLGDLWFREFYLDITKSPQFPIDMSLPWVLSKEILENPSNHTLHSVYYTLEIYNDAAGLVFDHLEQGFLFVEIEAEVNLIMDQFLYILPTNIYTYLKAKASFEMLDGRYRDKVQRFCLNNSKRTMPFSRERYQDYEKIVNQRHISLLGRSIDIAALLSERLLANLKEDLSCAISRFQSGSLCGITELESQLSVIRRTYENVATLPGVQVDSFKSIFRSADGSGNLCEANSLIASHVLSEIVMDIMPNFTYNSVTERFVTSKLIAIQKVERSHKPKISAPYLLYGVAAARWYEIIHRRQRGFISEKHMDALVEVVGIQSLGWVIEQLLVEIEFKIEKVIAPLVKLLAPRISDLRLSDLSDVRRCFIELYKKFSPVFSDDSAAKSKVFQTFRELGNAIAFVQLAQGAVNRKDLYDFIQIGPFIGFEHVDSFASGEENIGGPSLEDCAVFRSLSEAGVDSKSLQHITQIHRAYSQLHRTTPLWGNFLARLGTMLEENMRLSTNQQSENSSFAKAEIFSYTSSFSTFWNMLHFCLLSSENETCQVVEFQESGQISPVARYGDGFVLAGATILHSLGEEHVYQLWSSLRIIEHAYALQESGFMLDSNGETFVQNTKQSRKLHATMMNELQNAFKKERPAESILVFHPPAPPGQGVAMFDSCDEAKYTERNEYDRLTELHNF